MKCFMFCALCVGCLIPQAGFAENFIQLSIGTFKQKVEVEVAIDTGSMIISDSLTDSDNAMLLGLGMARITDSMYLTGTVYIPDSDDDYYLFEVSPNYRFDNNIYAGFLFGLQKYESTDAAAAQSIGANSSTIDLSGVTAGLSIGAISADRRFDFNLKIRFLNGDEDVLSGTYIGYDYEAKMNVKQTYQLTFGINF